MLEFETFVYLDVPKTGTSFIASFLKRFSGEKLIRKKLHTGVEGEYDASKFHFISVRDPFQQYLSLYSFGCEQKGKLFKYLNKRGLAGVYDSSVHGFSAWLTFVLEPRSAAFLPGYSEHQLEHIAEIVGFQSYRVLRLAMRDAETALANCTDRHGIETAFETRNIVQYTIRTETLRMDLENLIGTHLLASIRDPERARRHVAEEVERNKSRRVDRMWSPGSDTGLRSLVLEREWPLSRFFGY